MRPRPAVSPPSCPSLASCSWPPHPLRLRPALCSTARPAPRSAFARRLSAANIFTTVGRIDHAYRRYAIVLKGNASSAAALGDFVVGGTDRAPVRLVDVAEVREGHADPQRVVRSPRGPAAVVNVAR